MTLGEKIKHLRKQQRISVDELASKLGKNRATIYRYEKGDIENLPLDAIDPLAKALHTTPAYLMGWEDVLENHSKRIEEYFGAIPFERVKMWVDYFGPYNLSEKEYEMVYEYTKFLIYKRDN